MKHRIWTGSAGRTSRLGLTALICLTLVVSGAGSVASGADTVADAEVPAAVETAAEPGSGEVAPDGTAPVEITPETAPAAPESRPAGDQPVDEPSPSEQPTAEQTVAEQPPASRPALQRAAAPGTVAPLSVPAATGRSAVITVKTGGDRTGINAVGGLSGVRLRLHDGGTGGPGAAVNASWATCVSDAQGDCSFVVPETQERVVVEGECIRYFLFFCSEYAQIETTPRGANRDRQLWVVQESAPSGWYTSPTLVTGGSSDQQATGYRFRTGTQLRAGATYTAGSSFMADSGSSTRTVSSARWQSSRSNPQLPQTCAAGIDVALILDLSGSVANAGAVDDLKDSAIGFAESLEGTGSRLALFTFGQNAPRTTTNAGRNYPDLIAVDGNLTTIRDRIDGYSADGGTNWDRGIHQVAQNTQRFDLAIVITDGQATFAGSPASGPGSYTRFIETEQAIFSANALKAKGTRVLAVGVGNGIEGDAANLRAVSGPTGYDGGASANTADYFQTGWQQLAPLLENLAKGATCQATITVDKVAQPYGGQPAPAAGWTFDAAKTAGAGTLSPAGTRVTGASGSLDYTVRFPSPDAAAATVRIDERISASQRDLGWNLSGVSCTANGQPLQVTRAGDAVTVRVRVGDDVDCRFTNVQTREPAVEIVKRAWDVPSAAGLDEARELSAGSTVKNGSTLTWTYTVRNTGQTPLSGVVVTDDQQVAVTCPRTELGVGAQMVCTGSGPVTARP